MRVELTGLRKEFGDLVAVDDLSMTIEDGEFVSLVGPSGCGKTTTLRCIVGLETPTSGTISFDGHDVTDLPPKRRNVAMVFQNYALYPHMTARENMAFALRDEGMGDDAVRHRIDETAEMLEIRDHLDKRPSELSGGQKQRVALGRSLVRDPDVFLLDEPLSNLDAKLRTQMRTELQKIHQEYETTTIYVTHDQEEAMTMSDRIAILNEGHLQQVSHPEAAYNRPANRFVAGFVGSPSINFMPCRSTDPIVAGPFSLETPDVVPPDDATEIGVRPENFELRRAGEGGSFADATAPGTVTVVERLGSLNVVYVELDGYEGEITVQVSADKRFTVGDRVDVSIAERRFHVFAEDGRTLYSPRPAEDARQPGDARGPTHP
jgi:multiple sugar transport system ATP-binding protein